MAFNSNIKGYMTFGKSFSRGAAFPLEAYEIWTDYDALVAYAANTDPNRDPSYIGQKVAYVDLENNKVTHYGIEIDGTLKELGAAPIGDEKSIVIGENNTISLKGIDALVFERDVIGEDGEPTGAKEEVKYQPLMTKNGLVWIEPSKTTVEGLATLIDDLTARVKALEDDRVTEEELAAAVKVVADKVGVPAEGDESTATLYERIAAEILRATQAEEALGARIGVAKDGETAATGVYAYVDGVVNALVNGVDPEKIDSLNELIAWVEAHPDIVSGLDERLDKIEGVLEGIGGEGEKATVKAYVDDALTAHEAAADAKYAVATDVERDYAKKATTLEGYGITDAYDKNSTYSKDEVDELIQNINEGNQESAGAVSTRLETYITSNDKEIAALKEKDAAHDTAIGENKTLAQKGVDDAAAAKAIADQNKLDIAALNGQLGTTNTNVTNVTERLAALEAEVGEVAESRIDALEGAVTQHTKDIGANTTEITTLKTTTIPAIEQSVTNEATARDNADKAILAKIGDTGEKTVVEMIGEVAGTIDFTPYAKKDEVAQTYATIDALNEEVARADAAEKANAKAIGELDATLKAALENDGAGLDSIKELAVWIEEHETEVLPIIEKHSEVLAGIGGENEPATVIAAIQAAAYDLPAATKEALGGVKLSDEVGVNNDGQLEIKTLSTDKLVNGSMELVLNGGNATGKASAQV